jgi:hypothetical protein
MHFRLLPPNDGLISLARMRRPTVDRPLPARREGDVEIDMPGPKLPLSLTFRCAATFAEAAARRLQQQNPGE